MDDFTVDQSWRVAIRSARIQLYCGHDQRAMQHVIEAREMLLRERGPRLAALPHLASAQWLVRHHRYGEAQAELQAALDG